MRKPRVLVILGGLAFILPSCSDDDEVIPIFVTQTLSDRAADGDIAFSPYPEPDGE